MRMICYEISMHDINHNSANLFNRNIGRLSELALSPYISLYDYPVELQISFMVNIVFGRSSIKKID